MARDQGASSISRRSFCRRLGALVGPRIAIRQVSKAAAAAMFAGPAIGVAQTKDKLYHIGYASLHTGPEAQDEAFVQGLSDLGYVAGRNVVIEYRWAGNDMARFKTQVEELVRLKVDVIVTSTSAAVRVA